MSDYSQVESAMAMRSLQPQVKAIQKQYAGDQVFYRASISVIFNNKTCFINTVGYSFWDILHGYTTKQFFFDMLWLGNWMCSTILFDEIMMPTLLLMFGFGMLRTGVWFHLLIKLCL